MTCPLAGTGDVWLVDLVRDRIRFARSEGRLDEANLWSCYLDALERRYLDSQHFDSMMKPYERAPRDHQELALFGGWSCERWWGGR